MRWVLNVLFFSLLAAFAILTITGCTPGQEVSISGEGKQTARDGNLYTTDGDVMTGGGNVPPSHEHVFGEEGNKLFTKQDSQPHTTLYSEIVKLSSPKDVEMDSLTIDHPATGKKITIEGLRANISDPISAFNERVEQIVASTKEMTKAEKEKFLKAMETTEQISGAALEVLRARILPGG